MALRIFFVGLLFPLWLRAMEVKLPPRSEKAQGGHELVRQLTGLALAAREQLLIEEITSGNVPDWWRSFVAVTVEQEISGTKHTLIYQVAPDVLLAGDAIEAVRVPLSPSAAQKLADVMDCVLPTPQMANQIYAAAKVKLLPQPLPPGPSMTSFERFMEHENLVDTQRAANPAPAGVLVAGHKKDVVVSAKNCNATGKVAIFGWHKAEGAPIQPLYLGHTENWVDYSHGVRLVQRGMVLDGKEITADSLLADPALCGLLSDEGPVFHARYDTDRTTMLKLDPGIQVVIKAPLSLNEKEPVRLIIYATPNGGTAEQAIGRAAAPGDDWHYQIQNIGAQTHWLRDHAGMANLVVAYVEPEGKSWSAWRKKYDPDNKRLPGVVDTISKRYAGSDLRLTLTGHSGGGSFMFGYLNAVPEIPSVVERLAFMDSNYNWETERHAAKVTQWLRASPEHHLCVLAYKDYVALLEGKPFVSEAGGTWGRSQLMMHDLESAFPLERKDDETLIRANSKHGQVQFLLHQNPAQKILHTVIVERNGFIQALLSGTKLEEQGYQYFGERAYK